MRRQILTNKKHMSPRFFWYKISTYSRAKVLAPVIRLSELRPIAAPCWKIRIACVLFEIFDRIRVDSFPFLDVNTSFSCHSCRNNVIMQVNCEKFLSRSSHPLPMPKEVGGLLSKSTRNIRCRL